MLDLGASKSEHQRPGLSIFLGLLAPMAAPSSSLGISEVRGLPWNRGNGGPEVLNLFHDQHKVRGVSVFRGIAGMGESGEVHASDMLRLPVDLPLVIEFFDTLHGSADVANRVLPSVPRTGQEPWQRVH